MELRRLDLSDDAMLAAAHAVEAAATRHARPGWTPMPVAARIVSWRADDDWQRTLVGAFDDDDRLVGLAAVLTADDTPDTSWVSAAVLPDQQRRGVGSALVREAERLTPDGVTRLVASAYRRTAAEIGDLVTGFAEPLGYARATTETVVELDLATAELDPEPLVAGCTVQTYVGGVPHHLRPRVGVLKGLVDAEAPSGDLGWEPTPVTPEQYDAEIALWQQQGRLAIESLALDEGGDVVAWTCLVTPADPARPADIEGTLVDVRHRGRRLGRAVKVACLSRAREVGGTTRVRTSSDDANVWMHAINAELGFVPVESEVVLQRLRS